MQLRTLIAQLTPMNHSLHLSVASTVQKLLLAFSSLQLQSVLPFLFRVCPKASKLHLIQCNVLFTLFFLSDISASQSFCQRLGTSLFANTLSWVWSWEGIWVHTWTVILLRRPAWWCVRISFFFNKLLMCRIHYSLGLLFLSSRIPILPTPMGRDLNAQGLQDWKQNRGWSSDVLRRSDKHRVCSPWYASSYVFDFSFSFSMLSLLLLCFVTYFFWVLTPNCVNHK